MGWWSGELVLIDEEEARRSTATSRDGVVILHRRPCTYYGHHDKATRRPSAHCSTILVTSQAPSTSARLLTVPPRPPVQLCLLCDSPAASRTPHLRAARDCNGHGTRRVSVQQLRDWQGSAGSFVIVAT